MLTLRGLLVAVVVLAASLAEAQDKIQLKMGLPPVGLHELPVLVAEARGYFAQEGIQVSLNFMRGGSEAAAALTGKNIDVMLSAFEHALNLREKGIPVKVLVASAGLRDFALVVDAKRHAGVRTVKDIKGLRIAIPRRGSDGDQLLRFLLEDAGMSAEQDVKMIQIGGYQNHLTAIEKGDADGSMILEPFLTVGVRKGTIKSVVDLLQGEGPEIVHKRVWTVLVVTDDFYRARRDVCARIVRAVARAVQSIREDPAGTFDVAKKYFPTVEDGVLREIMRRHVETPRGQAWLTELTSAALETENQYLLKQGLIKKPQKYDELVATEMAQYWKTPR